MSESELLQKVQKLHSDGALSEEERTQLDAAVRARKQLIWFRIAAALLPLSLVLHTCNRPGWPDRPADALPMGFTQTFVAGAQLEYRWVPAAPAAPVTILTTEGTLEFRPHNQAGQPAPLGGRRGGAGQVMPGPGVPQPQPEVKLPAKP
jgi:hypothetical protein